MTPQLQILPFYRKETYLIIAIDYLEIMHLSLLGK